MESAGEIGFVESAEQKELQKGVRLKPDLVEVAGVDAFGPGRHPGVGWRWLFDVRRPMFRDPRNQLLTIRGPATSDSARSF